MTAPADVATPAETAVMSSFTQTACVQHLSKHGHDVGLTTIVDVDVIAVMASGVGSTLDRGIKFAFPTCSASPKSSLNSFAALQESSLPVDNLSLILDHAPKLLAWAASSPNSELSTLSALNDTVSASLGGASSRSVAHSLIQF